MPDKPVTVASFKDSGLGYPRIEDLLENENFVKINKSFSEAYDRLERIMKDRSAGLKMQKAAQKAMKAYELVTQLINELLHLKHEIIKMRKNSQAKQQKK